MAVDPQDLEYQKFKATVLQLTGVDLNSYKEQQMRRRLGTLLTRLGLPGFIEYGRKLVNDENLRRDFLDFITINVSEFFRNPERFGELERQILPTVYPPDRPLRVWSAGASNGSEAYTLAILLTERPPARGARILATDIDKAMLERARAGRYPEVDLKNVDETRRRRFFHLENGVYQVNDSLKAMVDVRAHDLLRDPYGTGFDLIVCRNVIIYFTDEAKEHLFRAFAQALRQGGVLFLGGTESFFGAKNYGFETIRPFFYRQVGHE